MQKYLKKILEDNNCLEKYRKVNYQAKKKGLRISVERDYSGKYETFEYFSITVLNHYGEPEGWTDDSCLYDGLEEMEEIVKNL